MQFLHLEPGKLLNTASLTLCFIKGLEQSHDGSREILLFQIDQTSVEGKLKGIELAGVELIKDILTFISDRDLVGSAGRNVRT